MKKFLLIFCLITSLLTGEEKKVALLFITRGDLNHTNLWKEWIIPERYNVYNHAKGEIKDEWFSKFRIAETQPNEWGFILLVEQALLKAALKDEANYKFVFLSESCVPLRGANEVHNILTNDDCSYMRWYNIWWVGCNQRTLSEFPKEHHWGNHTWYILNRKHAEMIANDDFWIHLAHRHIVGDEAYPSTFFSMEGVLHEFKNVLTTYVNWKRGSPFVFRAATQENYDELLNARHNTYGSFGPWTCLFARKVAPEFPDGILKVIQNSE
jgi:Core-2/I-Branching enzyme